MIRLSPLKERSAEREVTGKVQRIVSNVFKFGKKGVTLGRVDVRVVGSALSTCSSFTDLNFVYQLCISAGRED